MPLPLPDLDTRRWDDLVDEGRAQIPRYAPAWTDHNIHDPGITLVELVAWLTEGDIYRANWVPARHRRKFLELIGHTPRQPRPARGSTVPRDQPRDHRKPGYPSNRVGAASPGACGGGSNPR